MHVWTSVLVEYNKEEDSCYGFIWLCYVLIMVLYVYNVAKNGPYQKFLKL